jgi:hypothetical protein
MVTRNNNGSVRQSYKKVTSAESLDEAIDYSKYMAKSFNLRGKIEVVYAYIRDEHKKWIEIDLKNKAPI